MRDMESRGAAETFVRFCLGPRSLKLAGELGFEPRFSESESDVLPLNYSPAGQRAIVPTVGLWEGFTWGNFIDLTSP